MGKGGGGSSTTQTSNIPSYARPYVESMLGATQKQLFNTTTDPKTGKISLDSFKEYKPYSSNVQDYFAPMSQGQNLAYGQALNMQTPGQFGEATGMAGAAGEGAFGTVAPAYGYGTMGAEFGQQGAGIGLGALGYGQRAADIGQMGIGAAAQGFGAGERFARQATDPGNVNAYMSPYMQNVVDMQKAAAVRDYQTGVLPALSAQAARSNAFGSSRHAIQSAEAARNLTSQLQNIQAQGQQQAFQNAQAQQQFGANLGLQGLQAGLQGLQTGISGQQAGLQGIQGALAGTAQGMQGAQTGLQGVGAAQAGYGLANQAAQNLANIGTAQQQADLNRINLQNQLGQQQQAYQQQMYNQAIQDYATQQQYPLMQLGMMSNMLRGLPMQQMTTQGYQAYNPVSQLAGLGTAAYGATKMFGKKGGLPKDFEKKYDVGGAVESDLRRLPDEKLAELVKTSPSKFIREEAAKILKEHAVENAQNPAMAAGLSGLPIPSFDTFNAASGGIVAFAGGDLVDEEEKKLSPGLQNVQSYITGLEALGYGKPTAEQVKMAEGLAAAKEEALKDKEMAKYAALTRFGLGMAGAKTSNLAQAISEGGEEGLKEYASQTKAANEALNKIRSGEIDLNKLSSTERSNLLHYGITGATSEANAKLRAEEAREAAKLRSLTAKYNLDNLNQNKVMGMFTTMFNANLKSAQDKLGINKVTPEMRQQIFEETSNYIDQYMEKRNKGGARTGGGSSTANAADFDKG